MGCCFTRCFSRSWHPPYHCLTAELHPEAMRQFQRVRLSPPRGLPERKAGLGASFKRSTIRDGCRQSAPFDRIVTCPTMGGPSLPVGQMLEGETMAVSEKSPERKLRISAPGENTLLATIAICAVIFHILAATMLTS